MIDKTEDLKQYYILDKLEEQGPLEWIITLTKEPWTGIQYKPTKIRFNEDITSGTLKASLEYEIIFVPEHFKLKTFTDDEKKDLDNLIGKIVVKLIREDFGLYD